MAHFVSTFGRLGPGLCIAAMLSACVVPPPPPPPPHVVDVPPPPPPNTNIYAYPLKGQPPDQVDRDRYECYVWATKQSGFDPSAPYVPPHNRMRVLAAPPGPPPGTGTAVGAVAGAILGAAIAGPRDAGAGLLVGGGSVVLYENRMPKRHYLEVSLRSTMPARSTSHTKTIKTATSSRTC